MAEEVPNPPSPWPARKKRWAAAFVIGAAADAYVLLVEFVLRPAHARGSAQPFLACLNGLGGVIRLPPAALADHLIFRLQSVSLPKAWVAVLFMGVLFYAALILGAFALWRYCFPAYPSPRADQGAEPRRAGLTRRRFVAGMAGTAVAGAGGTGACSLFYTPLAFRVGQYPMPIDDLPESLDGLRVAQLTDIHHGPYLSVAHVRRIVNEANALHADLIVLTGDYVLESPAYIEAVAAVLADLRAKIGVMAVLGNHDWKEDGPRMQRALGRARIPLIDNARMVLTPDRRLVAYAEEGLAICGVGDLWNDLQEYDRAMAGLPRSMPRILLSHNPDVAEEPKFVSGDFRVDLMLCGHLHGGQVYLPGIGAPWCPSYYGDKYARGLVRGPTTRVFTSPGLGTAGLPVRFNATPEISVIELRRARG